MTDIVVPGLLLLGAAVALGWLVFRALSFTPAHTAYALGDAAQVERSLATADIPTRLALLTALGRYEVLPVTEIRRNLAISRLASTGVLGRVKGLLAPRAGFAALDPPCALRDRQEWRWRAGLA